MKSEKNYQPPFIMTPEILEMTDAVAGKIERARGVDLGAARVRAVCCSLAIEGNSLREEQIAAVREGRIPSASAKDIREAQNALAAYDRLGGWTPHAEEDLLAAHAVLMEGLLDDAGHYRKGAFRIVSGTRILHAAPPAERVPELMEDLMGWLGRTELHPLVAASAFHYEFEFIHPFADGSGRLGRLWQTAILCRWNPLFAALPVESALLARKEHYFLALKLSTRGTNCAPFIEFMLSAILDALDEYAPASGDVERPPAPAEERPQTPEPSRTPFSEPTYLEVGLRHQQTQDAPQTAVFDAPEAKRPDEVTPANENAAPESAGPSKTPFSEEIFHGGDPMYPKPEDGPQMAVLDAPGASEPDGLTPHIRRLLEVLSGEMSGQELQEALGLRDRKSFRERYVTPALQAGFIEMTVPDKPNSRLQKYRPTGKGNRTAQA